MTASKPLDALQASLSDHSVVANGKLPVSSAPRCVCISLSLCVCLAVQIIPSKHAVLTHQTLMIHIDAQCLRSVYLRARAHTQTHTHTHVYTHTHTHTRTYTCMHVYAYNMHMHNIFNTVPNPGPLRHRAPEEEHRHP